MKHRDRLVGLVVAAGYSSRMGEFKPLLPLGQETVVASSVKSLQHIGIQDVRVVVGYRAEDLVPVLSKLGVQVIYNGEYAQGMFSSIVAGVKSFGPEVAGFLLLPGDNPLIKPETVKELIAHFREQGTGIVYPCFNGQRGHPPLISTRYVPNILAWQQSGGMKALLSQYDHEAFDLEVVDQGVLLDMDTYTDYQKMLSYHNQIEIPTADECLAIFNQANTSPEVIKHGETVSRLAGRLVSALKISGCQLNIELVRAAGLLHDLAKGKPRHAEAGAHIMVQLGFPGVGAIIGAHTDIILTPSQGVNEAEIVYLADKLVKGETLVSLQDRFAGTLEKFKAEPEIYSKVQRRLINAEIIQAKIERVLQRPIAKLIREVE